ncbi:hypothetical protein JTB14_023781 [Gonioctena quinquepunctata]|nr:hypothetical protein JTB14_023781 [Gonioctena quinquepunctata]
MVLRANKKKSNEEIMSIEELRRSSRVTKGYHQLDLETKTKEFQNHKENKNEMARKINHEKQSITSKGTRTTSTSLVRRRNIQAELEAHRKLAEIAKRNWKSKRI